jgi:hypothetical protein
VSGTDDEARRAILARRARFIAAALATAGIGAALTQGCAKDRANDPSPEPCLSVVPQPQVCLEPMPPDDAGDPPGTGSALVPTSDAGAPPPQVCLSVPRKEEPEKPVPQPCLSPMPPSKPKTGGPS